MVQRLVRLHLGYSAQSGPLCERKTNVAGSNEKGALEGGVATERSRPAIEDLSRAKPVCFVLFFFSLCLCAQCEFCTSTSKEYLGWEAAVLVRKRRDDYLQDGVALHSTEHTLPLSPFMQKILEMASGAQSSKLELKGPWPRLWPHCCSAVCCGDHALGWVKGLASGFNAGSRISRSGLSHE